MKRIVLLTSLAALLACAPPVKQEIAATKQISADELQELLAKGDNIVFLDVREKKELETLGTVEGHLHIPLGELESRLNELHKEKLIVTI